MRLGKLRWAVAGFLFLTQCAEVGEDPKVVALRAAGSACKQSLTQADYLVAADRAAKSLADKSLISANRRLADELRFCQAYAKTLYALDRSSSFIQKFTVAMSDLFKARPAGAPYAPQATNLQSTILSNVITVVLAPLTTDLEEVAQVFDAVAANGDLTWTIDRLPVRIAGAEIFDAGGTYDTGEVAVLRGLVGVVLGALYSLQSLDYSVNIGAVVEYARLTDSPLAHYSEHPMAGIFNAAAVLLGTAPTFLALKSDGKTWVGKAGKEYTASVSSLLTAATFIKGREDDQTAHILEYKRADGQDYFVVHLDFTKKLSPGFKVDLSKFDDTTIPLREDVLRSITRVRDSLAAGGGVRASVQEDVFPILALVGVVALKSGALDASIDKALTEVDPELASKLKATVAYGEISQEHFLSLLLTAVPAEMEVDLGRMFAQPANLRAVIPAWTQPATDLSASFAMAAFTAATLVVEYECGVNPLTQGTEKKLFCAGPTDQGHFQDLTAAFPWQNQTPADNFGPLWQGRIAADGITSRGPYIGFKDPTFGGVLFMDYTTTNVAPPGTESFAPANQAGVNAILNTLTEAVLTVYQ
jgi:hypothetical protein